MEEPKLKRSIALLSVLCLVLLASSCDLIDVEKDRTLQVTVFEIVNSMDSRNSVAMTIEVPGGETKTLSMRAHPNAIVTGNIPYEGVDYYDLVDIAWYGKKEVTLVVTVGDRSANITVSEDKDYFLYEYPSTIRQ